MTNLPQEQEPALDYQAAMKLCSHDEEFLSDLIEIFLKDADSRAKMLTEALDNKDLIEIGRLAHSLKGLCANICAIPLKDISSCIEKAAENENLDDITQLRGEFESEFARLKDTLLKRFPPQKRSP